ncbi:peroxidase-like [Argiope bruennichi]|uniref:peroxidase-like n=1 Tax=Argiope bruennichi TaxID=94029 RepID=UPI002494F3F2|nr:peroxidase-like [Argiope bruennichi]XP_055946528.1 peroxidase-like [Argiope bruennichi]XP_055946529.1 peroxidase-like [Argiope bruennichi]XP_055946530.1 peroxidase-like [Argiope bruennichi]
MSYSQYFPQRLFVLLRKNWDTMFYARGDDGLSIEEVSEGAPLLATAPKDDLYETNPRTWRRYMQVQMKIPRVQTITGVLLGLLLLAMILMLVAEAIRESREPDPFLVQYSTSPKPFTSLIHLQNKEFQQAWIEGESLVSYRKNLEKMLVDNGVLPRRGSSSSLLQNFQKGNVDSQGLQDCAIIVEHMKKSLGGCIDTALLPDHCQLKKPNVCNESYPYRTFNGSCNNLLHPDWGMAVSPFRRLLRAEYADGVSLPRVSVTGEPLPNARYLSNELYTHHSRPRSNHTILTLYFGLFIDHDIIRITSKTGHKGAAISCCHPEIIENPSYLHPECMAIGVPEDDPFYGPLGVRCLDFVRSAPAPGDCPGEREQMNIVSSFLDASGVYGSFYDNNNILRSFKDGQMKVCWINNTEMLPQAHHISYQCGFPQRDQFCFRAGDMRANEQVELTALHTIWMREHNRVAMRLRSINPKWDEEKLFQESRRLVIAELQHIAYNEFLPVLLGKDVVKEHGVLIDPERGYDGYDPEKDPSIYNVFGAAAFRVGHSLIEGMLDLIGPGYTTEKQIPLHTAFLNPHIFYEKGIDLLLRGLVREKSQSVDSFITDEVRNRLFQPHNGKWGMDLSAIGIQRGRDHGLPGYTKWREFCKLPEVNSWEDLFNVMDSQHVQRLRKVYDSVEDIDLVPAALSENHLPGAMVGPVHACLIARQFNHLRYGDRFWFEVQNQSGSFTPGQLEQIYKSSFARILCDNSDRIEEIQRWALTAISPENPVVPCPEIPKVDLKVWTES